MAVFTIAQRKLPSFKEFEVDKSEKEEAITRVTALQTGLLNSLEQQGTNDSELARRLATLSFSGKLRIERPAQISHSSDSSAATEKATVVRRETVDLTPESPTGWDVDLFWCDGTAGAVNYRTAIAVGESLAVPARIGRSVAPGVTLGRIRVRPAPAVLQAGQGPARYTWIVADTSEGERSAAAAIQLAVNNALGSPIFGLGSSEGRTTRWYISAFICPGSGATSPPVAQPR